MWFSEGPEREAGTLSMGKLPICWVILRDHFLLLHPAYFWSFYPLKECPHGIERNVLKVKY